MTKVKAHPEVDRVVKTLRYSCNDEWRKRRKSFTLKNEAEIRAALQVYNRALEDANLLACPADFQRAFIEYRDASFEALKLRPADEGFFTALLVGLWEGLTSNPDDKAVEQEEAKRDAADAADSKAFADALRIQKSASQSLELIALKHGVRFRPV